MRMKMDNNQQQIFKVVMKNQRQADERMVNTRLKGGGLSTDVKKYALRLVDKIYPILDPRITDAAERADKHTNWYLDLCDQSHATDLIK
jgi:hypothetical protein